MVNQDHKCAYMLIHSKLSIGQSHAYRNKGIDSARIHTYMCSQSNLKWVKAIYTWADMISASDPYTNI